LISRVSTVSSIDRRGGVQRMMHDHDIVIVAVQRRMMKRDLD